MALNKSIPVTIYLTPSELAEEFCSMHNDMQAEFFNEIAMISAKWHKPFCFQLQSICDAEELNQNGRLIMDQIGKYAYKQEYILTENELKTIDDEVLFEQIDSDDPLIKSLVNRLKRRNEQYKNAVEEITR